MNIDPSKMDPKALMELSKMIQELPPEKLTQMQSLMHNVMAGHDVKREMEEFERSLPSDFRNRLMTLMVSQADNLAAEPITHSVPSSDEATALNIHEARITLLRGVAHGEISPEEAERLLFPN